MSNRSSGEYLYRKFNHRRPYTCLEKNIARIYTNSTKIFREQTESIFIKTDYSQ